MSEGDLFPSFKGLTEISFSFRGVRDTQPQIYSVLTPDRNRSSLAHAGCFASPCRP
jgi:hypothetical protein